MDSLYADAAERQFNFDDGFPNSLAELGDKGIGVVEDVLLFLAVEEGINTVMIQEADLTPAQAFRSYAMMPILVDFATHAIGRHLQLSFDTGLQEKLLMEMLENHQSGVKMSEMMDLVRNKLSRPVLYNTADPNALLDARTEFRSNTGIPLSVTLFFMYDALKTSHELSQKRQINLTGDPQIDVLDLTPTFEIVASLADTEKERVELPMDLVKRAQTLQNVPSFTETLSQDLQNTNQTSQLDDQQRG